MTYAEVIGDPIAHSKSPAIHNYWLKCLGQDASYRPTKVSAGELKDFLKRRQEDPDWRGCNLTMPLKGAAAELVDSLSPGAGAARAVNLITRIGAGLHGSNVDGAGFLEAVLPIVNKHRIRHAILIGSGGAARAIAHGLKIARLYLEVLARDPVRAEFMVQSLNIPNAAVLPLSNGLPDSISPILLINATPLGMRGFPKLNLDLTKLPHQSLIVDIVTHPLETPLIKAANARELKTLDGLHMLIGQAALSFGKLFGTPPPRDKDRELRELLSR
ncbi:MAG TPA: shikimate dehydrogenase [Sphingomicrobium sp.]|nr:shikimate dehydrogenase [Sphingomicrobium sp.]